MAGTVNNIIGADELARQNVAARNGGVAPLPVTQQNFFANGNRVMGRFEQPVQTGTQTQTNFTDMPVKSQQRLWQGASGVQNANPAIGPVATPYMGDAADVTPQPQTNFENMPQPSTGWNPDGSARYDALSKALSGYKHNFNPPQAEFKKDDSKRDGGFFSWLRGLSPKLRPGRREGETEDEYDRRMTTNRERLLALGDAMRHIGNIANTSKGAPVQLFNNPMEDEEARYQQRKADRQRKAALEADAAYKQSTLSLKEKAAEADRQYKAMMLGFKQSAEERARKKADDDNTKWAANYDRLLKNDDYNHKMGEAKFNETKRHNKVSEGQGAARIVLAQEKNGIARSRLAQSIANGGGSSSSMTNLSTPTGHTNRKKDLNSIEKKQLTQYLIKNGYIDKKNLDAYNNAILLKDMQVANNLQNHWIAFAANMSGKKGDQFRAALRDHYGYNETNTTSAPVTTQKKSVVTVTHNNKTGKVASKPKAADSKSKPASNKSKFHVD